MYFLVILMPPVSARPWELIPASQAASIQSWIWKMEGIFLWRKWLCPGEEVPIMYEVIIWIVR